VTVFRYMFRIIHRFMCMYIGTYICMCLHVYTHTHTHTHVESNEVMCER